MIVVKLVRIVLKIFHFSFFSLNISSVCVFLTTILLGAVVVVIVIV